MEVILKEEFAGLGHTGDLVTVKAGYGRNYLIPRGIAILATSSAKKVWEENSKQRKVKEEKQRQEAIALLERVQQITIKVPVKASGTGKIFGSVNTIMLSEALEKQGVTVHRKNLSIIGSNTIRETGTFKAKAKLFRDVEAEFSVEVYAE